jgi:conjugal transfer/entry exclusion protein
MPPRNKRACEAAETTRRRPAALSSIRSLIEKGVAPMKHSKKPLSIFLAIALALPAVSYADIVFDPSNYAQAVLQVANDAQLVAKFEQEVQNQLSMLKGWGYTQLPAI